jgi:hypothetical protein
MAELDSNLHLVKVTIQWLARRTTNRHLVHRHDAQGERVLTLAIKCQQEDVIDLIINAEKIDISLSNSNHNMAPIHYA